MRRWLAPIAFVVVSACAPLPVAPEHANERWVRLQTEHFDLSTDLPAEEARRAAETLEQTRNALLSAAWSRASDSRITSRTSVVVLRDKLDLDHYAPHYDGIFSGLVRPTIFTSGTPDRWVRRTTVADESTTSVLRHELVHRLAAGIYGRQPRWFAEGLAQFLETIVIAEDGKTATLGRVNLVAFAKYRDARNARVADALAWKGDGGQDEATIQSLYGLSWLLVHFLYNTQGDAFAAFQTRLAQGADPTSAWRDSFPSLDVASLDEAIHHYARFGTFAEVPRPIAPITPTVAARPITAADVLAIRAQLATTAAAMRGSPALRAEARRDVAQALALEEGNTLALALRRSEADAPPAAYVPLLRAQVRRRPDDGDAWLLLGRSLMDVPGPEAEEEREAALRRSIVLLPRSAEAHAALAQALVRAGRSEAALPFATKAALFAPWSAAVLDTHAAALFGVGRCPDALLTERRAIDLDTENARLARGPGSSFAAALARYERACGGAGAP
jgi:Protein of unknown function (DUF1570)